MIAEMKELDLDKIVEEYTEKRLAKITKRHIERQLSLDVDILIRDKVDEIMRSDLTKFFVFEEFIKKVPEIVNEAIKTKVEWHILNFFSEYIRRYDKMIEAKVEEKLKKLLGDLKSQACAP